jgi:hypothetical protein
MNMRVGHKLTIDCRAALASKFVYALTALPIPSLFVSYVPDIDRPWFPPRDVHKLERENCSAPLNVIESSAIR